MNAIPKQLAFFAALYIGMMAQPQAALVVPVGNPLVVNDTDLNVVWTQDANLFKTLAASNPDLVKQIISTTPTVTDSYYGTVNLSTADFLPDQGYMSWWGGLAWANYLNSIHYAGLDNWRTPIVTPVNGVSFNYGYSANGSTDYGYNTTLVNPNASELAHLFYNELGNLGYYGSNGQVQPNHGVTNQGPFQNLESMWYWTGTQYAAYPSFAWAFNTDYGDQSLDGSKTYRLLGWAVSPGQVTSVPLPTAAWLLGSALLGLVGLRHKP